MMPSLIISVQNSVEWGNRGVATATTQFFRTIGGAIWVAVMGAILNSHLQSNLADVPGVPAGVTSETLLNENTRRNLDPGVLGGMQEALANALHEVYFLVLLSAILATAVVFSSSRVARPRTSRTAPAPSALRKTRSKRASAAARSLR